MRRHPGLLAVPFLVAGCASTVAAVPTPTTVAEYEVTPPATFPDGTLNPCLLRDGGRVICDDWQYPVCTATDFTCPPELP